MSGSNPLLYNPLEKSDDSSDPITPATTGKDDDEISMNKPFDLSLLDTKYAYDQELDVAIHDTLFTPRHLPNIPSIPVDFDISSYISNYSGQTCFERLIFIAERCPTLAVAASKLLLSLFVQTNRPLPYKINRTFLSSLVTLMSHHASDVGPSKPFPEDIDEWLEQSRKDLENDLERLQNNLVRAKLKLGRANIWKALQDLGELFHHHGDFTQALRAHLNSREYASTPAQTIQSLLSITLVSFQQQNFTFVRNNIARMQSLSHIEPTLICDLHCWNALCLLAEKKYRHAAHEFINIPLSKDGKSMYANVGQDGKPASILNLVMSWKDVAHFAVLTALAEFDRKELQNEFINKHKELRKLINDIEPGLLTLITTFVNSQYQHCFSLLNQFSKYLSLDIYMHHHLPVLTSKIRNKAILQYIEPYECIDLYKMASAFDKNVSEIETLLSKIIIEGQLDARIDSCEQRLYPTQCNQQTSTLKKAIDMGTTFQRNAHSVLLRMNLMQCDFVVQPALSSSSSTQEDFHQYHSDEYKAQ